MLPLPASRMVHPSGARSPVPQMVSFIEEHREACGVEPIAPSTYYAHSAVARDPGKASDWSVHDKCTGRYGARKVWCQLRRKEGGPARCTVEWLMRKQGLQEVSRGRRQPRSRVRPCPQDKADCKFNADAPDQIRVANFTYVHTAMGTAYAAFVIDVFARKIVGWRVSTSMTTSFVFDALN